MIRRLTAVVAATAALALGVAGCSSDSPETTTTDPAEIKELVLDSDADEPEEVVVEEPAPEESAEDSASDTGGMSNKDACALIATKAAEGLPDMDAAMDDYQVIIDSEVALMDAIKEAGEKAADPEFQAVALETYELGMVKVDYDTRIHVDGDTTVKLQEALDAETAFSDSYTELLELCQK